MRISGENRPWHLIDRGETHGMDAPLTARTGGDLSVARARGDFRVHLVTPQASRALCGQQLRPQPPHKSFRDAGCPDCLTAALDAGHIATREGERAWINLQRV